jgi:hypothetical protein
MNKQHEFTSGSAIRYEEGIAAEVFGLTTLASGKKAKFKVNFSNYHAHRRNPFAICSVETGDVLKLSGAELLEKADKEYRIQQAVIRAFRAMQRGERSSLSGLLSYSLADSKTQRTFI